MAKLYFRYGAMNSGKSTALMQVAHNYEEQGMKVLILKPQVDTKGGGELVSRLGVRRKADLLIPPELNVFEAVKAANDASGPLACVLCDESQFFTPEQAEQLFMITVDLNIPVICYGLRADFSLKGFPGSLTGNVLGQQCADIASVLCWVVAAVTAISGIKYLWDNRSFINTAK